jgi:Ca2+-binding RTX toxin-like protein
LAGGSGNDFLDPGAYRNDVYGEAGNDTMVFHQDQPIDLSGTSYQGGDGNDTLVFADNADIQVVGLPLPNQPIPGYSTTFFFANAAYVGGVEVFDASLASKLVYVGQESLSVKVIGTENNDQFFGRASDELFVGGAGNDFYTIGNGSDTIISNSSDEDDIVFLWDASSGANAIYGFNGVGDDSGDLLQIQVDVPDDAVSEHSPITISEQNGYTVFDWEIGSLVVDAIGLVENFDYTIHWG